MRVLFALLVLAATAAANAQSSACDVEEASALAPVYVDVGMWQATWNGFDYQLAAWRQLGSILDDRYPNLGAGSYAVQFTYTASLFGVSGTNTVTVCIQKDANETFEEATVEKLDELSANSAADGQYGSGGIGGGGDNSWGGSGGSGGSGGGFFYTSQITSSDNYCGPGTEYICLSDGIPVY